MRKEKQEAEITKQLTGKAIKSIETSAVSRDLEDKQNFLLLKKDHIASSHTPIGYVN